MEGIADQLPVRRPAIRGHRVRGKHRRVWAGRLNGRGRMNKSRLFITSCISIGTAAMVFAIRGDVAGPMSAAFHITNEQMGLVFSPAFFAFTLAIVISGNLVDVVGMRALHALSALGFITGVMLVILAPHQASPVISLFDNV